MECIDKIKKILTLIESVSTTPFKTPQRKWFFGKKRYGTPYFYPRKWSEEHKKYFDKKWFGIDVMQLGWKTKWNSYRHEWNPCVIVTLPFNFQLVCIWTLEPKEKDMFGDMLDMSMWEGYLTWTYDTDHLLCKQDRMRDLIKKWSCVWEGNNGVTDYSKDVMEEEYYNIYLEAKSDIKEED